jgi:chemotaxis protein methyltransferase CheR
MELHVFEKFRSIVYRESGIVLTVEKLPLLSSRIQKRLTALGLKSDSEYLSIIELDVAGEELVNLIDVISTNVTHFYREATHFEKYRDVLKEIASIDNKPIKIWCAAASSGEEPYTLAFEAQEVLAPLHVDYRILATDICTKVLHHAIEAVYDENTVSKIPAPIRHKYLNLITSHKGVFYRISENISKHLLFKKLNLVAFPYPLQGQLDVIFCRNVMIYFDTATRAQIVAEFWRLLKPGGYLFLSHSENLLGIDHKFSKGTSSVFRKE